MVVKIAHFSILNALSFHLLFLGMLETCTRFCEYLSLSCDEHAVLLSGLQRTSLGLEFKVVVVINVDGFREFSFIEDKLLCSSTVRTTVIWVDRIIDCFDFPYQIDVNSKYK